VIFLSVAPGVVAGWIPYALSGWRVEPPLLGIEAGRWIGGALVMAGSAVLLDSFARFALEGRGTPAPVAPTQTLVVSGLYRHVRNPMYLGVAAAILGQALLFGSVSLLAYTALVWGLFHIFVLAYEEPTLRRRYGDSLDQCRLKRSWAAHQPVEEAGNHGITAADRALHVAHLASRAAPGEMVAWRGLR
jgi:protein-S-isoprenylcysteine O-methyltransferase Ste14